MSPQVTVQGLLKADGTLELDTKPELPPGRVTVMLQPLPTAAPPKRIGGRIYSAFVRNGKRQAIRS